MIDPLIVMRAVHFTACTLALGTLAFGMLGTMSAILARRFRIMTAAALTVAALSAMAWLALIARKILDVPLEEVLWQGGLADVAADTQFGRVACLRFGLIVFTGAALLLWRRSPWPALLGAAALIATIAFTGHAGAGTGPIGLLHLIADMAHLVAAGVWLGALPSLAFVLLAARRDPTQGEFAADLTRRFSVVAMIAVAVLLLSGIVNAAILVGLPSDPFATAYGRALALKVALFAAMLALAALNRFALTPALPRPDALAALAWTAFAETALGLGAVFLAAVLGTLPPANHVHTSSAAINRSAAYVHIHTSQAMADLTIDPGRAGQTTATIRLWHEDFTPYAAERVQLTLEPPVSGLPRIEREAHLAPDGTWIVGALNLGSGGAWTARITVENRGLRILLDAPIVLAQCSNEC